MLIYMIIASVALGICIFALQWAIKTLLPRSAGVAVDQCFDHAMRIVGKIGILTALAVIVGLIMIVKFG